MRGDNNSSLRNLGDKSKTVTLPTADEVSGVSSN